MLLIFDFNGSELPIVVSFEIPPCIEMPKQ
jgi:hypothetical protein